MAEGVVHDVHESPSAERSLSWLRCYTSSVYRAVCTRNRITPPRCMQPNNCCRRTSRWKYSPTTIPICNDDVREQDFPQPVQQFRERIALADGMLIVSSEYNLRFPNQPFDGLPWEPCRAPSRQPKASSICGKCSYF
jgi:NADPH-dependent FMN reductase